MLLYIDLESLRRHFRDKGTPFTGLFLAPFSSCNFSEHCTQLGRFFVETMKNTVPLHMPVFISLENYPITHKESTLSCNKESLAFTFVVKRIENNH